MAKLKRGSVGGRYPKAATPHDPFGGIRVSKALFVARSLGLEVETVLDLVVRIEAGLPYRSLERFQAASALDSRELSDLLRIPSRTLARRRSDGRFQPDESDRLVRASRVFDRAVELFEGDAPAATTWLRTPQPGLGNRKPLELASTDLGGREVEDLIGRLEHGVFS